MTKKSRYWSFLIYPDSCRSGWIQRLEDLHLPIAVSPLHDKDVNSDGEVKKPHYHVMLCFDGPTTQNVLQSISDDFSGVLPVPVVSVKGMFNYFSHKDNPEKYQYNDDDIICLSGFNIEDFKTYTSAEVLFFKVKIIELIRDNNIYEYYDLLNYLMSEDLELFSFASGHTLLFDKIITSFRHKYGK